MIREANLNDSSRISEIHVFGWRCAYKDFISIDFLFNELTVKSRDETWIDRITNKKGNNKICVYEEENIIKGFMTMGDCRDDDKNNDTFELQAIYIDPLFQRQHIGTQLVKHCIKEAKDNGKKEIVVWVFEKNINSIQFYKKMGFNIDGKTKLEEIFNENEIRMKI